MDSPPLPHRTSSVHGSTHAPLGSLDEPHHPDEGFTSADPPGLPFRSKPHHNTSVPSDIDSVYADSMIVPVKPTPLSLPLHYGFDRSRSRSGPGAQTPPTPPPMNSWTYYVQPRTLASPPHKHRHSKSLSVTDWKMPSNNDKLITPVMRSLTTMHACQSSNVNPFVTPFDDEHCVTIDHASHASDVRRSIPRNPFAVTFLVLHMLRGMLLRLRKSWQSPGSRRTFSAPSYIAFKLRKPRESYIRQIDVDRWVRGKVF
jgi:hypothetical protein